MWMKIKKRRLKYYSTRLKEPMKVLNSFSLNNYIFIYNHTLILVLKDPHKRAIYDCVGVKGLKTEGWEIIHRTKTPQEIREEYEALAR